MPKIIGVKFKKSPKIYYFEAGDNKYKENCGVIVETARGIEFGEVKILPTDVDDDKVVSPLKPVMRLANEKDYATEERNAKKRDEAYPIIEKKIQESKLKMRLSDVEYTFDGNKMIVYFTADNRIDFRDLVKDLASTFRTRIELRQIGPRDECKMLGGIAPCGRACCCSDHMSEFSHVSIKMAKTQNLSLNPQKISGLCGKLMCCLAYENEYYADVNKHMPKVGSFVKTENDGSGIVFSINQLKDNVTIKKEKKDGGMEFVTVPAAQITFTSKKAPAPEETIEAEE
ncbi:MAG: stage 0 sporulation family protein [Firmicutes bacterium]|nr:stage 0 sporulation family protein [Bacillota bacterium]MDY5531672.1 stage 0 sporulation family protein [Pumilibacteraceae bacterium]